MGTSLRLYTSVYLLMHTVFDECQDRIYIQIRKTFMNAKFTQSSSDVPVCKFPQSENLVLAPYKIATMSVELHSINLRVRRLSSTKL